MPIKAPLRSVSALALVLALSGAAAAQTSAPAAGTAKPATAPAAAPGKDSATTKESAATKDSATAKDAKAKDAKAKDAAATKDAAEATPAKAAEAPATTDAKPADTAANGDAVVAVVNGKPITQADLAIAADDPALSLPGVDDAQKKSLLVDYMVDLKVGAQAAEAAKIGESPDFARKLAYFRDKLLLDDYLEQEAKKVVTPEAEHEIYDQSVKLAKPEEEVHARHILVESEAEAKKVAARLKAGEDFSKVAAETSKDPGSKAEGGDLGWFTKERMVPDFANAAFAMKAGQVSDPVKTQFGWHVIKVEEKRMKPQPTFDELKEQIDQHLIRKAQQDLILKLRAEAKIERKDAPADAEAAPAPAAPPPPSVK